MKAMVAYELCQLKYKKGTLGDKLKKDVVFFKEVIKMLETHTRQEVLTKLDKPC